MEPATVSRETSAISGPDDNLRDRLRHAGKSIKRQNHRGPFYAHFESHDSKTNYSIITITAHRRQMLFVICVVFPLWRSSSARTTTQYIIFTERSTKNARRRKPLETSGSVNCRDTVIFRHPYYFWGLNRHPLGIYCVVVTFIVRHRPVDEMADF